LLFLAIVLLQLIVELQGQCFKLREWRSGDAAALQKHADNTNIFDFLFDRFPSPYTTEAAETFINSKLAQDPMCNFVIEIEGELAGVIGVDFREDIYRKSPLLGYWISEMYWGRGIMPQAVKLVVAYAFSNFDIVRIQASVNGNNNRSMRVLEKAGFVKEGILKSNIIKNGIILDEHVYGIVK